MSESCLTPKHMVLCLPLWLCFCLRSLSCLLLCILLWIWLHLEHYCHCLPHRKALVQMSDGLDQSVSRLILHLLRPWKTVYSAAMYALFILIGFVSSQGHCQLLLAKRSVTHQTATVIRAGRFLPLQYCRCPVAMGPIPNQRKESAWVFVDAVNSAKQF